MVNTKFINFWFKYQYANIISRLNNKKTKTYLVLLLGKYPPNVVEFLKVTLAPLGDFRFSLGQNSIALLIDSKKTIEEIDICAKSRFENVLDHYIIFKRTRDADNHYIFNMNKVLFSNLYKKDSNKTVPERLNVLGTTLNLLIKNRDQFNKFIDDVTEEVNKNMLTGLWEDGDDFPQQDIAPQPETEIEELNRILEKVVALGYENITNEEKLTLSKFK